MSLQAIVIAALALIILIVLILIFTGQTGVFTKSVNACTDRGYSCESACDDNQVFYSKGGCEGDEICCAPKETLGEQLGFGN